MAAGQGFVAVVGARVLPEAVAPQVADVVRCFLSRGLGHRVGRRAGRGRLRPHRGGGRGAGGVRALGGVPAGGRAHGGGGTRRLRGAGRACGARRRRGPGRAPPALTAAGAGVGRRGGVPVGAVARVGVHGAGSDPGGEAGGGGARRRRGRPARVRRGPVGAVLLRIGAPAFRWHPEPRDPSRPSWLARVFQVPAGEPTHAQLAHIAGLSAGERLWFERGVLAGDTVLVRARGPVRHAGLPRHPAG